MEWPPCAQDHGNVDLFGAADHTLIQHATDLISQPVVDAVSQLRDTVAGPRADERLGTGGNPGDLLRLVSFIDCPDCDQGVKGGTCEKTLGECCVVGVEDMGTHLQAYKLEESEGPHRQPQRSNRLVHDVIGRPVFNRVHCLAEELRKDAIHHESRGVRGDNCGLTQFSDCRDGGRHRFVRALGSTHYLHEWHDGHRVKEVNSHHPRGVGQHRSNICDRKRGRVRGENAVWSHVLL